MNYFLFMLPITGFPGVVEEFADWFSRNLSFHQLRRFKQYLSGLITGVFIALPAAVTYLASRRSFLSGLLLAVCGLWSLPH